MVFTRVVACVLGLSVVLAVTRPAAAQVTTADLVGRVSDESGSVLPGASVTAMHVPTGAVRSQVTTSTGDYAFNLLPIGPYTVTIEIAGFKTHAAKLTLGSGDRGRVDARLELGAVSETVQVTAEAALLQTDSSTVSSLISERLVQDLPAPGRNLTRLIQLIPGANEGLTVSTIGGTRPDERRQTSAIAINGANDAQNNQLIDGVDNNERAIGTVVVKPSVDAVAEIKVQTSMYTAEVGRTAGGVVNIITKSGSNEFHGSAFEFVRDGRFDSRNYFDTRDPDRHQNQFGGSWGGPIRRNQTFFFVDYEGTRLKEGQPSALTVPTLRMRQGDFSEVAATIYDPLTSPRVPFPGNVIPANRLSPAMLKYMQLYPLPSSAAVTNNYQGSAQRKYDADTADWRVDHRFNGDDSMVARYSYNRVRGFSEGNCPATTIEGTTVHPNCPGVGSTLFPGPVEVDAHSLQGNYVRVINPTLIAEVKGGYMRLDNVSLPLNTGTNASQLFGIPNANTNDPFGYTSGLTLVTVTGYPTLGDVANLPLLTHNRTRQMNGAVTKTTGAHNVKMGGAFIVRDFVYIVQNMPVGGFGFDALLTNNGAGVGGHPLASMLLGYPSTQSRVYQEGEPNFHTVEPSAYLQDDWRATSWLTLNLGVRYEVFTPLSEKNDGISNFDPATGKLLIPGQDGVGDTAGVKTDYSNVSPRLGASMTLPHDVVVRGGFGLTYFPANMHTPATFRNPPNTSNWVPPTNPGVSGGLPSLFVSTGFPVPTPNSATDLAGNIAAVDANFKSTRTRQFNVFVEKAVGVNVVGAGYVGSRTDRAIGSQAGAGQRNLNQPAIGPGNIQTRRPYFSTLPNVVNILLRESIYNQWYDALQLVFQRRYSGGLTVNSNYTWAQAEWNSFVPWEPTQIERFDAPGDIRHRVVLSATYELPWLRDQRGFVGKVLGGWQVNGVAFYQTGLPFDVTNAAARTNTGAGDRPNMIADPMLPGDERTVRRWFNTAAFVAQPQFTAGDTPRAVMHGPPHRRIDMSFFKDFTLKANHKLQVRAEIYNLSNIANFANPNGQLGNVNFGVISDTGTGIARQMQFGVKYLF